MVSNRTEDKPLFGKRVLVTRPREQAGVLAQRLAELGAEPVGFPTIRIVPPEDFRPLDEAIARLPTYDWVIFTSVNGVRFFWERLVAAGLDAQALARARLGAIGPATAEALAEHGLRTDYVPQRYVAEAIVEGIDDVAGQRILLPRADIARQALAQELRARGAVVDEVTAYRTIPVDSPEEARQTLLDAGVDIATFTSSSTVRNFAALLGDVAPGEVLRNTLVACIGPITAQTAEELGIRVDVVAQEHTIEGLVQVIVEKIEENHGQSSTSS